MEILHGLSSSVHSNFHFSIGVPKTSSSGCASLHQPWCVLFPLEVTCNSEQRQRLVLDKQASGVGSRKFQRPRHHTTLTSHVHICGSLIGPGGRTIDLTLWQEGGTDRKGAQSLPPWVSLLVTKSLGIYSEAHFCGHLMEHLDLYGRSGQSLLCALLSSERGRIALCQLPLGSYVKG